MVTKFPAWFERSFLPGAAGVAVEESPVCNWEEIPNRITLVIRTLLSVYSHCQQSRSEEETSRARGTYAFSGGFSREDGVEGDSDVHRPGCSTGHGFALDSIAI
jgi:hypothetical protein